MNTIWKFPLAVTGHQAVEMPQGARLLSCQPQNGQLCLWALVDDSVPTVPRLVVVKGAPGPDPAARARRPESTVDLVFVGTVVCNGGALVWHVFDGGEMARTATNRILTGEVE